MDRRRLAAAAWRPIARHRAFAPCRRRHRRLERHLRREIHWGLRSAGHNLGARGAGACAEPGNLRRCAPTADRTRRHTQYRRLPAVFGCGSTRPGHARRWLAQEHRSVQAGARNRSRLCPGLGGASRNLSAHLVRRRRHAIRSVRAGSLRGAARSGLRAESGRSPYRTGIQALLVRLRLAGRRKRVSTSARDQSEHCHGSLWTGKFVVESGPAR